MSRSRTSSKSPLKVIVTVLAVIVMLTLIAGAYRIHDYSQDYIYEYDARDYIYDTERGTYGSLYNTAVKDMNKRDNYSADVAEYRALAFYYEQAVLEHAYRMSGNDEKADAFAERMSEYESQLGSLEFKAKDVREAVSR